VALDTHITIPDGYEMPGDRPPSHHLHLHYRPIWRDLCTELPALTGRVLDVGCGLQPYRALLGTLVTEYIGLDRPGPYAAPDVEGDARSLPFPDHSFDGVMSTQVLEHVVDPAATLREIARVLRPGGRVVLTCPGTWPAHEVPHDYWRFTRFGLQHLFASTGFDAVSIRPQGGTWSTLGQMLNLELHHHRRVRRLIPLVNRAARSLERRGAREELVMNWLVTAQAHA
jgi:SAM-dependent methyltransferase